MFIYREMNKLITRLEDTDLQMGEIQCSISEDRLGHVSTMFNAFIGLGSVRKV